MTTKYSELHYSGCGYYIYTTTDKKEYMIIFTGIGTSPPIIKIIKP